MGLKKIFHALSRRQFIVHSGYRTYGRLHALLVLLVPAVAQGATIAQPSGYYIMQAVHSQNVKDNVLASSSLAGMHVRDEWALMQPTASSYSFSWMDSQVARAARLGKQVTLGIYAGQNSPTWLGAQMVGGAPLPWDPHVDAEFVQMVVQLGQHYATNPAIVAVHISSPATAYSMEMYLPNGVTRASGYSDQSIINVWKQSIDAYNAAFPNTTLVLDLAMVPDARGAITKAVDEYARQVLGNRFNAIICNLKASTSTTAPHYRELLRLRDEGVRIGFEMVGPSNSPRFEGSFGEALAIGQAAGGKWYQIYQQDIPAIPKSLLAAQVPEVSVFAMVGLAAVPVLVKRRRALQ